MARGTPFRLAVLVTAAAVGLCGPALTPEADAAQPVPAAAIEPVPWQGSSPPAPLASSAGVEPAKVQFPPPQRWTVTPGAGSRDRAVQISQAATPVEVEVFDRDAAARAGAAGFVFTVRAARPAPLRLTVDYAEFADAFGAGYADRLRLARLPECAVVEPLPTGCRVEHTVLDAVNDRDAATLSAVVTEPGAFAVISAVSGDEGTFAATPLSLSGSWQVAAGSGAFTYSYPFDLPAPAGGTAPTVSLGYSSAAIDGLTVARNPQASPSGVGWSDFANAFIERRYEPCFRPPIGTSDLCWMSDNATISLAGISGPLLPVNASNTEWRAQSDPGWKVERLTGAQYTTIHQGQYWKVTGPDGTQYFFGSGQMPGRPTNSIMAVSVVADNPGEPCRGTGDVIGGCDQGWRWYLDRVVDPDGNTQSFVYEREDNWYHSPLGAVGGRPMSKYHRGALLKEILYGGQGWDANAYSARVVFGLEWRCGYLFDNCPTPTPGHGGFPDVPTDLICAQTGTCAVYAPSFFTGRRYGWVRSDVKVGTEWKPVTRYNIVHSFGTGTNGVAPKLQVEQVQQIGVAFAKLTPFPPTRFGYVFLDNRADHGGLIAKAMRHNRLATVTNPFGGVTRAAYVRNRPCSTTYNPYPRWDLNDLDCFPQSIKDGAHLRTGVFNKYVVRSVTESAGLGSPDVTTTYTYEGTPAWAFDTGAFARDEDETGWSVWRGYGTVLVTRGTSKTRMRLFRGWDGDPMLVLDAGN